MVVGYVVAELVEASKRPQKKANEAIGKCQYLKIDFRGSKHGN